MIKRNRPRPNNGGMRQHRPHQNGYSSNSKNDDNTEVRLKNRGYYQQMFDKYTTAARESLSLGERIEAEGHFQHAEHYLRQLNDRIRYDNEIQQQQQQRYQAQQAQQQAAKIAQQASISDTTEIITEDNTTNNAALSSDVQQNDNAISEAPAPEKRPYRKRVLRTPHRRHTSQDNAAAQPTPNDSVTTL